MTDDVKVTRLPTGTVKRLPVRVAARLIDPWSRRPLFDVVLVGALIAGHVLLIRREWPNLAISSVSPHHRPLIYGALATVAVLAAGTNNAAIGSYVGSNGPLVEGLRRVHGMTLRKSLLSVSAWLWTSVVLSLVCLALDPFSVQEPASTRGGGWIAEGVLLVIALKFARLTLIQTLVLTTNDMSSQEAPARPKANKRSA